MEQFGFVLWELTTLLFVIASATAITVLRRKAGGRAGFSEQDRLLYFGDLNLDLTFFELALKLCGATILCLFAGLLEHLILAHFGAGLLTGTFILTSFSIVRFVFGEKEPSAAPRAAREHAAS
jgi:hypothetical protein